MGRGKLFSLVLVLVFLVSVLSIGVSAEGELFENFPNLIELPTKVLGDLFDFLGQSIGLRLLLWLAVFTLAVSVFNGFRSGNDGLILNKKHGGMIAFVIATISAVIIPESLVQVIAAAYGGLVVLIAMLIPVIIMGTFSFKHKPEGFLGNLILAVIWIAYAVIVVVVYNDLSSSPIDPTKKGVFKVIGYALNIILFVVLGTGIYFLVRGFNNRDEDSDSVENGNLMDLFGLSNQPRERELSSRELNVKINLIRNWIIKSLGELNKNVPEVTDYKNEQEIDKLMKFVKGLKKELANIVNESKLISRRATGNDKDSLVQVYALTKLAWNSLRDILKASKNQLDKQLVENKLNSAKTNLTGVISLIRPNNGGRRR